MVLFGLDKTLDEWNESCRKLDEAAHGVAGKSEKVMLQEISERLANGGSTNSEIYLREQAEKRKEDVARRKEELESQRKKNAVFLSKDGLVVESRYRKKIKIGIFVLVFGFIQNYFAISSYESAKYGAIGSSMASSTLGLCFSVLILLLGAFLVAKGFYERNLESKYSRYLSIIVNEEVFKTSEIAKIVGEEIEVAEKNLEMMFNGKYVSGHINKAKHRVYLDKGIKEDSK